MRFQRTGAGVRAGVSARSFDKKCAMPQRAVDPTSSRTTECAVLSATTIGSAYLSDQTHNLGDEGEVMLMIV